MTSHAASAQYGVTCPRCKGGPDEPCRTATGRVADAHRARIDAYWSNKADEKADIAVLMKLASEANVQVNP